MSKAIWKASLSSQSRLRETICPGCEDCAKTPLRASARPDFPPRAMKTGASPMSPRSRALPFSLAEKGRARVSDSDLQPWRMEDAAAQLVFVDGQFRPRSVRFAKFARGRHSLGLKEAIAKQLAALEAHLGRYLDIQRDAFTRAEHRIRRRRCIRPCRPRRYA